MVDIEKLIEHYRGELLAHPSLNGKRRVDVIASTIGYLTGYKQAVLALESLAKGKNPIERLKEEA